MTQPRLQLVFLGQLVDDPCRDRPASVTVSNEEPAADPIVLWHDLGKDEMEFFTGRVGTLDRKDEIMSSKSIESTVVAPDPTASTTTGYPAPEASPSTASDWTPFPELMPFEDQRPPPPWAGLPTLASRTRPKPSTPRAPTATKPPHEVRCPNCSERQTMRVLCRKCASFLDVALKAKAERDAQTRAKARSSGFMSLFGR